MTFFYQIPIKHEWSTGAIWNSPARESSSEWWMVLMIRRRDERETLNDTISLFIVIELGWSAETMPSSERLEWCLIDGENIAKWVFKHEKLWIIKWASVDGSASVWRASKIAGAGKSGEENIWQSISMAISVFGYLEAIPTCLLE